VILIKRTFQIFMGEKTFWLCFIIMQIRLVIMQHISYQTWSIEVICINLESIFLVEGFSG